MSHHVQPCHTDGTVIGLAVALCIMGMTVFLLSTHIWHMSKTINAWQAGERGTDTRRQTATAQDSLLTRETPTGIAPPHGTIPHSSSPGAPSLAPMLETDRAQGHPVSPYHFQPQQLPARANPFEHGSPPFPLGHPSDGRSPLHSYQQLPLLQQTVSGPPSGPDTCIYGQTYVRSTYGQSPSSSSLYRPTGPSQQSSSADWHTNNLSYHYHIPPLYQPRASSRADTQQGCAPEMGALVMNPEARLLSSMQPGLDTSTAHASVERDGHACSTGSHQARPCIRSDPSLHPPTATAHLSLSIEKSESTMVSHAPSDLCTPPFPAIAPAATAPAAEWSEGIESRCAVVHSKSRSMPQGLVATASSAAPWGPIESPFQSSKWILNSISSSTSQADGRAADYMEEESGSNHGATFFLHLGPSQCTARSPFAVPPASVNAVRLADSCTASRLAAAQGKGGNDTAASPASMPHADKSGADADQIIGDKPTLLTKGRSQSLPKEDAQLVHVQDAEQGSKLAHLSNASLSLASYSIGPGLEENTREGGRGKQAPRNTLLTDDEHKLGWLSNPSSGSLLWERKAGTVSNGGGDICGKAGDRGGRVVERARGALSNSEGYKGGCNSSMHHSLGERGRVKGFSASEPDSGRTGAYHGQHNGSGSACTETAGKRGADDTKCLIVGVGSMREREFLPAGEADNAAGSTMAHNELMGCRMKSSVTRVTTSWAGTEAAEAATASIKAVAEDRLKGPRGKKQGCQQPQQQLVETAGAASPVQTAARSPTKVFPSSSTQGLVASGSSRNELSRSSSSSQQATNRESPASGTFSPNSAPADSAAVEVNPILQWVEEGGSGAPVKGSKTPASKTCGLFLSSLQVSDDSSEEEGEEDTTPASKQFHRSATVQGAPERARAKTHFLRARTCRSLRGASVPLPRKPLKSRVKPYYRQVTAWSDLHLAHRGPVQLPLQQGLPTIDLADLAARKYETEVSVVTIDDPVLPDVSLNIDFDKEITLNSTEPLGVGSCGSVFSGFYKGHPVAVKFAHGHDGPAQKGALQTLKQEVSILSRVRHPNIVRFYGANLKSTPMFIVEELMESDLSSLIHGGDSLLPLDDVLRIGKDIATGLWQLHPTILHRDLKPSNLLLDKQGVTKASDFGTSRFKLSNCTYMNNAHAGTIAYMAPECFQGGTVTAHADVFSWAVIMAEMLTGQPPWYGCPTMAIIYNVVFKLERPELPVDEERCPPELANFIRDCWSPNPKARPGTGEVVKFMSLMLKEREQQSRSVARPAK